MKANPIRMKLLAGEEEYSAGRELEESGRVKISERDSKFVRYTVASVPPRSVLLRRDLTMSCDCETFQKQDCCRHVTAAWLAAERTRIPESMLRNSAPETAQELTAVMQESLPAEPNLGLEVTLVLPSRQGQPLGLGLRTGNKKLYVIRDTREFLQAIRTGTALPFGRGFVFEPSWMRFSPEDENLLKLIRKVLLAREDGSVSEGKGTRLLRIPEPYVPELMELLQGRSFRLMDAAGTIFPCAGIQETVLPLRFELSAGPRGLTIVGRIPEDFMPLSEDGCWGVTGNAVIRVKKNQRALALTLWKNQYDGRCLFEYPLRETERVIGEVLPWLKTRSAVEVSGELRRRLVQRELRTEVYMDRDGKSIAAQVHFRYGDIELNPFAPVNERITLERGEKLLLRDAEAEHQVLDILSNAGFRVGREQIRLSGSDAVFDFVTDGLHRLQEISEVYLSREFKRMLPRRPSIRGSMRMHGDQLELIMNVGGEPTDEILELIEALSKRRRYYRLKTGEFLDLNDLSEWQETAAALYEAARKDGCELNRDSLQLRAYRAGYLSSLLENSRIPIEQDESVHAVSEMLSGGLAEAEPELAPGTELKAYQRRGLEWMAALDRMHMGGILADDMGLGKTVQIIALLTAAREENRVSLVVAPTSLTYNWLSEVHRFAPEMGAAVLSGNGEQRSRLIRHILENHDVRVLITSYPLIRRDIELLKDYTFRFVILDEAQNIKNAGSMAAAAVKQLQADTRFALTGTPMENGVGELWSIFDFVLPGYLPGYNTFLRRYQDGENAEDLLRRIRPFLLRRLKQEVLEELPDKTETIMTARMTPEQDRVYRAALDRLRPRVNQMLDGGGLNRGRMEVLSAITELRQICCHPGLVLEDYRGGSGKEELVMDILPGLISEGRRVLLFSQFTGMLKMLRTRLEENGVSTLYLDGDTPADDRLSLTERFNGGEGDVFLISLRAGGSGLNLIGADTVIHYDPWWNPATEDQATDRAHRIGQTKKVLVIRLVTHDTIEEQVVELGNRKKALFDRLITPGESALSALSEQDIRALFA